MGKKKYLLVCEGPTDIEILKAISKSLVNKNGHTVEITELAPQMDATSGTYPRHGWPAVRAWCRANRVKTAAEVASLPDALRSVVLRKNWKTLTSASLADGLIIQLDTDIAEMIVDLPTTYVLAGVPRRAYCEAAIAHWLNVPKIEPGMYLVLSTYSTETWLLACHNPSDPVFSDLVAPFDYENIPDIEARLLKLGYKKKSGRLNKKPKFYKGYAQTLVKEIINVRGRCAEADAFCDFIENM